MDAQALLYSIFQGKDSLLIMRQLRDWNAKEILSNLRRSFAESDSVIPFNLLANYLAEAQIALGEWWQEKRQSQTLESLAQTFHRLQLAAIPAAFGMRDTDAAELDRLGSDFFHAGGILLAC